MLHGVGGGTGQGWLGKVRAAPRADRCSSPSRHKPTARPKALICAALRANPAMALMNTYAAASLLVAASHACLLCYASARARWPPADSGPRLARSAGPPVRAFGPLSPVTVSRAVTNALNESGDSPAGNWRTSNPMWEAAQDMGSPGGAARPVPPPNTVAASQLRPGGTAASRDHTPCCTRSSRALADL